MALFFPLNREMRHIFPLIRFPLISIFNSEKREKKEKKEKREKKFRESVNSSKIFRESVIRTPPYPPPLIVIKKQGRYPGTLTHGISQSNTSWNMVDVQ